MRIRTMALKVYDYLCESCGFKLLDKMADSEAALRCRKCAKTMTRLFPCPRTGANGVGAQFRPFWSDTFQMRVRDREDLRKLKDLRKQNGLECIGHQRQRPDRKAIRHNFETE